MSEPKNKSPAFQFYPADFLLDTAILTAAEVGAYWRLCSYAWKGIRGLPQCHIPSKPEELARMVGMTVEEWSTISGRVLEYFTERDDNFVHRRLEKELQKQNRFHEHQRKAGKRGAEAKWSKARQEKVNDGEPIVRPKRAHRPANGQTIANDGPSSSFSSTSSPSGTTPSPNGEGRILAVEVGSNGHIAANELVGFWIDAQPERPPNASIAKQGKAAQRICSQHSREEIVRACVGIGQLFPHSDGQPWDLFDLERKFAKAFQAAVNHPEIQSARFETEFMERTQ